MSPDDLLRDLARVSREEAAMTEADARWEKLALGELSAAEEAELRREAASNPEAAALYEAFRPLGAETKGRIAARLVATARTGKVVPMSAWRRAAIVVLPLAAAAAAAAWLARPASGPGAVAIEDAPLPDYALSVSGGDRATRSIEPPALGLPIVLQRDSRLEIVLRPSSHVSVPVAVRGFLLHEGEARAWSPAIQRSSDGSVRIAGPAGELLGVPSGAWKVAFAVGRAERLPQDPGEVARAVGEPAASRGWQLLVTQVRLTDAP